MAFNINGESSESIDIDSGLQNVLNSIPDSLLSVTTGEETQEEQKTSEVLEQERIAAEQLALQEKEKQETETKEETKEITTETSEDSVILSAIEHFGLGEADVTEVPDESIEGLLQIATIAVEKAKLAGIGEGIQTLYKESPIVKDFVEHVKSGGTPATFQQQQQVVDFSKLEVKEDDLDLQEALYRRELEFKGNDEDAIEDLVSLAKDKDQLLAKSLKSKEYLTTKNKEIVDVQIKKEQEEFLKNKLAAEKEEAEIRGIIKAGKIGNVQLKPEEITKLESWSLVPDKETGMTARDKAYSEMTLEQSLILDHIVMNGFQGLGIKIANKATSGKTLADLKNKAPQKKTIDLTNSAGNSLKELGISNVKDLFNKVVD